MTARLPAIALVAAVGCGGGGGGADAAADTPAGDGGTPLVLRVSDGSHELVVETDPLVLRLVRADGSIVVESAPDGAILFGVAAGGDIRYHSPLLPAPRGVRYLPLAAAIERLTDASAVVSDAEGRRAVDLLVAPVVPMQGRPSPA